MSYYDEIAVKLAALGGVGTPQQVRQALSEFDVRDIQAVRVSQGSNGGSQSVKHEVIGIDYTDIDTATGLADLYLLPENETIVASWPVITVVFDGQDSFTGPFGACQAYGPSGAAGGAQFSDSFTATATSGSNAIDGLISPDPSDGGGNNTTTAMLPIVAPAPGGGSVQTVIDFAAGNVPVTQGSQGHMDYHLIIAVTP